MQKENLELTVKISNLKEAQVLALQAFFNYMRYLGNVGSSRYVAFYSDGDGSFRPKFEYKCNEPIRELTEELSGLAKVKEEGKIIYFDFDSISWKINHNV